MAQLGSFFVSFIRPKEKLTITSSNGLNINISLEVRVVVWQSDSYTRGVSKRP